MKKLFILMLVLGMTSAASAVSLTLTQPDPLIPEAIVGGDLDQDLYIVLLCDGPMSVTPLLGDPFVRILYEGPATDIPGFYPILSPDGKPYMGEYWGMAASDISVYPIIGGEYLLGAASFGDWVYALWFDEVSFTPNFIGEISLVPEPMTLALVGLGGLFVLRRRK